MSVIIRLQNLPLTASSIDIRNFFHGLGIPDGGVHIVGGPHGDAFIAFSTDEDARQAMRRTGQPLKGSPVSLLLSSRNEMYKVIEQARLGPIPGAGGSHSSPSSTHLGGSGTSSSPPTHPHHLSSHVSSSTNNHHHGFNPNSNSVSSSMSPTSSGSVSNDFLRNLTSGGAGPQADLSSNPALLFSTMSAIPSATLGGANNFLAQQHQQQTNSSQPSGYQGLLSTPNNAQQQQQQNQTTGSHGLPFGAANNPAAAAAALSAFANGNPFLVPPPNLSNMNLPFNPNLNMLSNAQGQQSTNNSLPGMGQQSGNNPLAGMGAPTPTTGGLGLPSGLMNSSMSMAGQQSAASNLPHHFGNPPPRMSLLNNGNGFGVPSSTVPPSGVTSSASGSLAGVGGPRLNSFGVPQGIHNHNAYGAGVGANNHGPSGNMGNRQNMLPTTPIRPPFGNVGMNMNNGHNKDNMRGGFQLGAIPSGRADFTGNARGNENNMRDRRRSRSGSRERREALGGRRRRSRSRDKDRMNDRRRRRSRSNSRSRSRDRLAKPLRRESRDKRRSDSSPDKSSQDSSDPRGAARKREHEPSPPLTSTNTTTEQWPGAKLTGIPSDASYREIKEFIRAEVMGGSDGVVRLYEEGIAFLKLMNATDFPRVFKSNLRKLRGSSVTIEGITMETWTQEYKLNKSRIERDIDREKEERERERSSAVGRGGERDKDSRSERHHNSHHNHSGNNHRSSRFSSAVNQSNCIAIRGLAPTITKHELCMRYFQDAKVHDMVLIPEATPTNRHSVTAYIHLDSPQVAQGIVDVIARSNIGTTLVVEVCDVEDLQKAKQRPPGGPPGASAGSRVPSGPPSGGSSIQDAKSIFDLDLGLDDETTTVIMKGAPPNISERDVFDFFSDIGLAPMNVRILYDTDGQCSGQVICEFPDNNKAKRATTKDGMLFGRGQISVSLLPSRNKSNQGGSGGNIGEFGQSNNFVRNPTFRPGLLGPPPLRGQAGGAPPGAPGGMRFSSNPTSTPNIFEQALQQQLPGPRAALGGGRGGARGPSPAGGTGRMSRFSDNTSRNDFRNQNGAGRGRPGNNHPGKKDEPQLLITDDEMALFNKKGCVIGLENIPYKASMDDILEFLQNNLRIRISPDRIIRRYDDMQKPTGDARVAFDTEFEAKLACDRLSGTYMWNRPISAAVIE